VQDLDNHSCPIDNKMAHDQFDISESTVNAVLVFWRTNSVIFHRKPPTLCLYLWKRRSLH